MNVLEKILEEIDNIEKEYSAEKYHEYFIDGASCAIYDIRTLIRAHMNDVPDTNVGEWIAYTVKNMPKKKGLYLVTCDDEKYPVKRMRFECGIWYWTYGIYDGKILAWMELPEPYKPEEQIDMKEPKKCPFCGGKSGYYMIEKVHRSLCFNWDGEPNGASEDVTDWESKRMYCADCHKILPRKRK